MHVCGGPTCGSRLHRLRRRPPCPAGSSLVVVCLCVTCLAADTFWSCAEIGHRCWIETCDTACCFCLQMVLSQPGAAKLGIAMFTHIASLSLLTERGTIFLICSGGYPAWYNFCILPCCLPRVSIHAHITCTHTNTGWACFFPAIDFRCVRLSSCTQVRLVLDVNDVPLSCISRIALPIPSVKEPSVLHLCVVGRRLGPPISRRRHLRFLPSPRRSPRPGRHPGQRGIVPRGPRPIDVRAAGNVHLAAFIVSECCWLLLVCSSSTRHRPSSILRMFCPFGECFFNACRKCVHGEPSSIVSLPFWAGLSGQRLWVRPGPRLTKCSPSYLRTQGLLKRGPVLTQLQRKLARSLASRRLRPLGRVTPMIVPRGGQEARIGPRMDGGRLTSSRHGAAHDRSSKKKAHRQLRTNLQNHVTV